MGEMVVEAKEGMSFDGGAQGQKPAARICRCYLGVLSYYVALIFNHPPLALYS